MLKTTDIATRLLEKKVISEDQLAIALKEQERSGGTKTVGSILVAMGFISDGALGEILGESTGGSSDFDIKSAHIDSKVVKKVPQGFAVSNKLIALSCKEKVVSVGMADVFDIVGLDKVKKFFPPNYTFNPVYVPEGDIMRSIDRYYEYEMSIEGIAKELENEDANAANEEQLQGDYKSPVVRLIDAIFTDAVHKGASDIHFEPEELFLRIRYRIDGKLVQARSIHKDYWKMLVVRIKILSNMNIAENRKAQDGNIQTQILGSPIDFRVSIQPTINGENVVMRILDEAQSIVDLNDLGFSRKAIKTLKKVTKRPEGMIILTGPTGSGKTTTLYSLLSYINSVDKNIMTLENPVEYHLPLIRQTNIRPESGITFAAGIRTLLRQDPDVILVGEIRDEETAVTAIQAAMTGHQVYSSLHTNDAIGSISRLLDMKVPAHLVVGNIICVVSQRLARTLCSCKEKGPMTDFERKILGKMHQDVVELYAPVGCEKCDGSGYKGRVVISEILPFDPELDELIANSATKKEILRHARQRGFVTLDEDGLDKAVAGLTDIKELMRVVDLTQRF